MTSTSEPTSIDAAVESPPSDFEHNLCELLKSLRLKKYWPLFEKQLKVQQSFDLDDAALKDLGLPLGARKKLMVKFLQMEQSEKENRQDQDLKPFTISVRIRRVVKTATEVQPTRRRKQPEHAVIERVQPSGFDRSTEMEAIHQLYTVVETQPQS